MAQREEGAVAMDDLVKSFGPAASYLLDQLDGAIGYYGRAKTTARKGALLYVGFARTCYVLSGMVIAASLVGAFEHFIALAPGQLSDAAGAVGLPLSAPKWSVAVLTFGYLLSQYAQRRGFTRAWTRYAACEQAISGLRREYVVNVCAEQAEPALQQAVIASSVKRLNELLETETRQWARDLMVDFDRVHALMRDDRTTSTKLGSPSSQSAVSR